MFFKEAFNILISLVVKFIDFVVNSFEVTRINGAKVTWGTIVMFVFTICIIIKIFIKAAISELVPVFDDKVDDYKKSRTALIRTEEGGK